MAVRSYLDQVIQNEAAARAAGAPVTRGSFTDIANREVGSGFVDRALGTIPANTPPPAPAFQQTLLSGLLAQLQSATPEQQQQVARFAPQLQGLLGPVLQDTDIGRDEYDPGGYDPETPVGFGEGRPEGWSNEMINSRLEQLNKARASYNNAPQIGGVPIRSPLQTIWGGIADKLGWGDNAEIINLQGILSERSNKRAGINSPLDTPSTATNTWEAAYNDTRNLNEEKLTGLGIEPGDPGY